MPNFVEARLVGITAAVISIAVYQFNKRGTMLGLSMIGALLWSGQYRFDKSSSKSLARREI